MVTLEEVCAVALALPGSYQVVVRDRIKIRVGRYVYVAFSRDETQVGFGFDREERAAMIASRPEVFLLPSKGDLRYHWIEARMAALDHDEMRELINDAWRMCAPRSLLAQIEPQSGPKR